MIVAALVAVAVVIVAIVTAAAIRMCWTSSASVEEVQSRRAAMRAATEIGRVLYTAREQMWREATARRDERPR
jgi:flagellar basal body-associated protein FliL